MAASRWSHQIEVWGDYACFTRPEMKAERVSYEVMTPSSARGVCEAIYWHPGMRWIIDRITVMNPIKHASFRTNEVSDIVNLSTVKSNVTAGKEVPSEVIGKKTLQRETFLLRDVRYVISAHFELTERAHESDRAAKFASIFERRLARGQCYHTPYLGMRDFPAHFRKWGGPDEPKGFESGTRTLGYMLYDMDYSNLSDIKPLFFNAVLTDGVLDLTNTERLFR
jgi:CRISPR-associated protein Cas5d